MTIRPIIPEQLAPHQREAYDRYWPEILRLSYVPLDLPPSSHSVGSKPGSIYYGTEYTAVKDSAECTHAARKALGAALDMTSGEILVWACILKEPERPITHVSPACLEAIMLGHALCQRQRGMPTQQPRGASLEEMSRGDFTIIDALSQALVPLEVIGVHPTDYEIYLHEGSTRASPDNRYWISHAAFLWVTHHYYRDPVRREQLYLQAARAQLPTAIPEETLSTELQLV